MRNPPDRISSDTLSEIRRELEQLSAAIPMFSSWRIAELGLVTERYAELLLWLDGLNAYHNICRELIDSLAEIRTHVTAANETEDWRPYNQAKIVLELDMMELIAILPASP